MEFVAEKLDKPSLSVFQFVKPNKLLYPVCDLCFTSRGRWAAPDAKGNKNIRCKSLCRTLDSANSGEADTFGNPLSEL